MPQWVQAGLWGLLGGSALLLGALVALYARTGTRIISVIMAIGAGVLISAVSFDLMDEAFKQGGFLAAVGGLSAGALIFFGGDALLARRGAHKRKSAKGHQASGAGLAIALGSLLDGIPESVAIGVSLLAGGAVGWTMVAAVFLSNVPESLSSATGMAKAGYTKREIMGLWVLVALVCGASASIGNVALAHAAGGVVAFIQAFAAGAILAMLASTMMPEAYEEGGAIVGLVTAFGFLIAFVLDKL